MGFGFIPASYKGPAKQGGVSVELMHRAECNACPLNNANVKSPKMPPSGTGEPDIYMLGAFPGVQDDRKDEHFAGELGRVIKLRIPSLWHPRLRWNHVIRTMPPERGKPPAREPAFAEIECCRPSIERDIARTEPLAIFGFGNVPLKWALKESRITNWSGRKAPIVINGYPVWFFPMLDPDTILQRRKFAPSNSDEYGCDEEFAFAVHMWQAFEQLEAGLPIPKVHNEAKAREGVTVIDGSNGEQDCERIIKLLGEFRDYDGDVGQDYETDRLRPYRDGATILTASLSSAETTIAFPMRHSESRWNARQIESIEDAWEDYLNNARGRKIAHTLAFEMEWAAEFFGRKCLYEGQWDDTAAQAYILDERQDECLSLDFLCIQYFGLHIKDLSNVNRKKMGDERLADVLPYNCLDSKYARLLYPLQAARLEAEGLTAVYRHHMTRIPATVLTQRKGIPIDQEEVKKLVTKYADTADDIEADIMAAPEIKKYKQYFGKEFNVGSAADVLDLFGELLRFKLATVTDKKTGKERLSSKEDDLDKIKHPLAKQVTAWRHAWKSYATYCKPILEGSDVLYEDGCVHPILSTLKVRTWRTSSEGPNSQNYPHYGEGADVRQCIRKDGYKVVSFDYGGIQARNVAMESYDRKLIAVYWDRYDIHTDWLERLVRRYPKFISLSDMKDKKKRDAARHLAKNRFVFPSFFGARFKSIAANLEVPHEIIQDLQAEFYDEFRDVAKWHKKIAEDYHATGYVTGHSGFRRHAPISVNELINAPIQADESIIVLSAHAAISERRVWDLQPNMEIHDDLTFLWPAKKVEEYSEIIVSEMCKIRYPWINVPMTIERSIGDNWHKMEKAGEFESDKLGYGPERPKGKGK